MSKTDDREREVWESEAKTAERIIQWFELLMKIHEAAQAGVDPGELIARVRQANREALEHDRIWLMEFIKDRFVAENRTIGNLRQLDNARRRACPYTAGQYDAAVQVAGTKQQALARELGVSRKTLRKYGRPAD